MCVCVWGGGGGGVGGGRGMELADSKLQQTNKHVSV